jgi:hypothetical protein
LEKCKISDGLSYKPAASQFPEEDVMDIINRLAIEINLPSKEYVRACRKLESSLMYKFNCTRKRTSRVQVRDRIYMELCLQKLIFFFI